MLKTVCSELKTQRPNMPSLQSLCRPIQRLLYSAAPHHFHSLSFLFLTSSPKPISKFIPCSLYSSGSPSISHASVFKPTDSVGTCEKETINVDKLMGLKQKIEVLGINFNSCKPGEYSHLLCPKCKGGLSMERSLSFHISPSRNFAMWRCFRFECGWAGQVVAEQMETYNEVHQNTKVSSSKQLTQESLGLEPLGDELVAYFAKRRISKEILQKNAVMQILGEQNVIAFTYWRNGVLVSCKYRTIIDKKFWQEKATEKILYGLDGIKEADEIIIVEGEIDKLSVEEAGFCNCVSVPDGAPQKVSAKELPSMEKDTRFQYLWNCKEYLDRASRIILATDGDIPGQVLAEELARRFGKGRCWQVSWPKKSEFSCFKDANEVLTNLGSRALRDAIDNAELYRVSNFN